MHNSDYFCNFTKIDGKLQNSCTMYRQFVKLFVRFESKAKWNGVAFQLTSKS